MKKDNRIYLKDILEAINKIEGYTKNVDFTAFQKDQMRQDAVVRQLEIIGEAAGRISNDFVRKYSDFPIKEAKRMRNFLIHGYDEVNLQVVWKTIGEDIPLLKEKISRIL